VIVSQKLTRADSQRGLALVMLSAVLWGTVGIATNLLYQIADTNPISIGFFRLAFAVPALFVACWFIVGRRMFHIHRRDLGLMLLIGAMLALYQVCFMGAVQRAGVSVAVLVTLCTAPVLVALLSVVFLRERMTGPILLALACAIAGTLLLIDFQSTTQPASDTVAGVLLALGSALGYAVFALCGRRLASRYHPLQSLTVGFGIGALLLLLVALPTGLVLNYSPAGWGALLYLGLVPTALGYVIFLYGMKTTPATVASIATLVEPLTGTLLAMVLFGERLAPAGWIGALFLLGAMGLLYLNGRRA
jgi:DME family drug/metabolite transporter